MDSNKNNLSHELQRLIFAYFPENVASQFLKNETVQLQEGIFEGSTLFLDIRGFTKISEKIDPKTIADLLNLIFKDFIDIIYSHQGSINKFMGDAILVTFGIPFQSESAAFDAVCCALAIVDHINLFNQVKPDYLTEPLDIGIGISSGKLFAGPIGSYRRLEYTVIGDIVNTASRLQNLTKKINAKIIIDSSTKEKIKNHWSGKRFIYQLRGKSESQVFYTVDSLSHRKRHEDKYF